MVHILTIFFHICLYTQVAKEVDATFPISLALEFPVKSMLLGMLKLTEYLIQLPEEKPTSKKRIIFHA